jgi:2,4-dienoyl-CoA reductase-like NADH-dependent reductase (Old Yellow Enzyme family)
MATIDPLPTHRAFVERLRDAHPNFGYIHVTESREIDENKEGQLDHSKATLRSIWGDRPYIAAGGFDGVTANSTVEKHGGLVAFGRKFISNVSAPFIHQLEAVILTTPCNSPIYPNVLSTTSRSRRTTEPRSTSQSLQ